MIPNYKHVVEAVAARYPQEWRQAHTGSPQTDDFIKILAWELHQLDQRVGLNGKRGNPIDTSDDALCYNGVSLLGDVDPHRGDAPVTVIDVIGAAGGPNPTPQWGAVGPATPRPHAAWIKPQPAGQSVPPVTGGLWTAQHQDIVTRLGAADTRMIAEQLAYSFPAESWGQKRADASRPISKDVVARLVDGALYGMRVVPVSGQPFPMPGQVFVPVSPVNYLGDAVPVPPPPPPPVPTPPPVDPPAPAVLDIMPRLDAIDAAIVALATKVDQQRQEVIDAVRGQSYDINANIAGIGKIRGTINPKNT